MQLDGSTPRDDRERTTLLEGGHNSPVGERQQLVGAAGESDTLCARRVHRVDEDERVSSQVRDDQRAGSIGARRREQEGAGNKREPEEGREGGGVAHRAHDQPRRT